MVERKKKKILQKGVLDSQKITEIAPFLLLFFLSVIFKQPWKWRFSFGEEDGKKFQSFWLSLSSFSFFSL